MKLLPQIDPSWTLFLDRDGVINKKLDNDYVKNWDEFEFLPNVLKSLAQFAYQFKTIVVVTNQQGIGKGIMTTSQLKVVHDKMLSEIQTVLGRIDKIYFAPYLAAENHSWRKPRIGMALEAKKDFPHIDFQKSILVGDSESDIEFGNTAGMFTVKIVEDINSSITNADFSVTSLSEFATKIS